MEKWKRFPWNIFWRFFFVQLLAFNILAFAVISIVDLRYRTLPWVYNEAILNFAVFSLIFSAATSWLFTKPLEVLILKAMRLASRRVRDEMGEYEEDLLVEEAGEYWQIENALNRIDKKLKRKRERFIREREENQAFMSAVAEGLVSVGLDGKVVFFNSQFAAQFVPSAVLGRESGFTLSEVIRVPELGEAFQQALKAGQVQKVVLKLPTLMDSQSRFFAVTINPLVKRGEDLTYGSLGIFHDITELKRAEQIRIDFVGNASHELRTPLTSIKGYMETLKDDLKSGNYDYAAQFADVISRNVDRLIDLVNDLLSISQLESHSELKIEPVSPMLISEQIVAELKVLMDEKGQNIRVFADCPSFMADQRKVAQVLRNLVSNSVKYIGRDRTIEVRWQLNDKKETLLSVKDDGPGIPPEHHDRLFERFYRIDKGRARDAGGTGLGLAIVKHIMQSHGGSVSIRSEIDHGAEFICVFPASIK